MSGPTSSLLPQGITRFHSSGAGLPTVEFVDFKWACHGVALIAKARVIATAEGQVTPNFHWAAIQTWAESVWILCSAHYPWLAFAETDPQAQPLRFVSNTSLLDTWASFPEFRVLHLAYLEPTPTRKVIQNLNAAEH